jgi:hypothetical protein
MEVSRQLHAPAALSPGKYPQYPSDRRLGGHHSRSGRGEKMYEESDFLLFCRDACPISRKEASDFRKMTVTISSPFLCYCTNTHTLPSIHNMFRKKYLLKNLISFKYILFIIAV